MTDQPPERERFLREMRKHHQTVRSEPVSFIAGGNGPMIVRPSGMSDADWREVIRRETKSRRS